MSAKTALKCVAVSGEFTVFNALSMRELLLDAVNAADEVEVDLAQVTEIDSSGLQLMVAAKREAAERGRVLRFTCHSPAVLDTLDLTNLSAHLGDPLLIQSRA
jgi:anti-anti-sigma factor